MEEASKRKESSTAHPPSLLERKARHVQPTLSVLKSKLQRSLSCSLPRVRSTLSDFFPVVRWLPKYKLREYVWGDAMSGLIVGIILVPQAIAYCLLAGVEPIYGLYTSFYANIIYFLMGTSRHVSVGIFSLMSLMVGQLKGVINGMNFEDMDYIKMAVTPELWRIPQESFQEFLNAWQRRLIKDVVYREVFRAGFDLNEDSSGRQEFNGSFSINLTASQTHSVEIMGVQCGKECYAISIAAALTFLAGIYQVLMAVFRLGFVSVYLSAPMLDGFATGASFTILTVQAKYLLGLKIPRHQGYGTVVVTWINIFANIHKTNVCDLITSAICIIVLVAGKEIQERYKDRLKIPLPTELVVVAGATLASHFGNLNHHYGTSVSGHIPTGFIPPQVPSFSLMPRVALDAVPMAVISFAFTVSLSEMFAKKNGYTVRPNQEMFAIGCCNIIPSFFHCFTTSAALAKTMVKDSTGCQTQVSSLISALVILLVLLFFAPFFSALQKCVLACIIIVSLRGALRKFKDLPAKWRASRNDAVVWLITMSATALISVELGLLVGITFSMICIVYKTQNPRVSLLGRAGNSDLYEDVEEYQNLVPPTRVRVFRFQAPLYYANKDSFLKALYKAVGVTPFLEMTSRKKAEKKAKKMSTMQTQTNGDANNGDVIVAFIQRELDFHTIILDCSAIPFIDSTGMAAFKGLLKEFEEIGVRVVLACCNTSVIDTLRKGQLFGKGGKDMSQMLFHTVHHAILHTNVQQPDKNSEDSVL